MEPTAAHLESIARAAADVAEAASVAQRVVTAEVISAAGDVAVLRTIDGTNALCPVTEYVNGRPLRPGLKGQFLVIAEGDRVVVSPSRAELVEALFAGVVPELLNGQVRVMGVARAPGVRTKIAVAPTCEGVDAVGSFVGRGANRVRYVSSALGGERVDVVAWHPDAAQFLRNALQPASVTHVALSEPNIAVASAPVHQMSAAVGEAGLNSQLAGHLTGLQVTIKPAE